MGTLTLHSGDSDSTVCKPEIYLSPPGRLMMKPFPLEDAEKRHVGKEVTTTHNQWVDRPVGAWPESWQLLNKENSSWFWTQF